MNKFSYNLEKYLLLTTVFLIPLIILPFFPNPFGVSKLLVLVGGVSLTLLVKCLKTIIKGSLEITSGNFDLPVFLLLLIYLAAAITKVPNKMEAFFLPGTATVIIASALLYFLLNQINRIKPSLRLALFLSGLVFSFVSLLAASGLIAKIPQLPAYIKINSFNLEGGVLPGAIFLATLLPLEIQLLIIEKKLINKIFYTVASVVLTLGLIISIYFILPGKVANPKFPSLFVSWSVAIDTIKNSPFVGVGPSNYLSAFNLFRPVTYNASPNWALRFNSARNFYLTAATETGVLGLIVYGLLLLAVYNLVKKTIATFKGVSFEGSGQMLSLIVLLILLAVFPASNTLIILLFILLALNAVTHSQNLNLKTSFTTPQPGTAVLSSHLPAILMTIPIIAGIVTVGYFGERIIAGEIKYNQALNYLIKNDGNNTYNTMREALVINPYVDRYHSSYGQISLSLARVIAQKQTITDQDRNTIAQLVSQAIREGKAAVTLNPQRSSNWEILARVYQSIMAFAQGADNFAIQTYNQAIIYDPVNPVLRISLGGVYYALGRYDDAIKTFELAVIAKPDYANAHYNLAIAYREKGEIQKAIDQMKTVLSLVKKDSADYNLAKKELEALEAKLPTKEAEGTENLTPPQPAEKPVIQPPLELPEEATPPASK